MLVLFHLVVMLVALVRCCCILYELLLCWSWFIYLCPTLLHDVFSFCQPAQMLYLYKRKIYTCIQPIIATCTRAELAHVVREFVCYCYYWCPKCTWAYATLTGVGLSLHQLALLLTCTEEGYYLQIVLCGSGCGGDSNRIQVWLCVCECDMCGTWTNTYTEASTRRWSNQAGSKWGLLQLWKGWKVYRTLRLKSLCQLLTEWWL